MRFTFGGMVFSIVFRHDKSRRLSDHFKHDVGIVRRDKQYVVKCRQCDVEIGNVRKADRDRKTYCAIRVHSGKDVKNPWITIMAGCGNPNEDAGDRFSKEAGRLNSLANALLRENFAIDKLPPAVQFLQHTRGVFKQEAWACFNGRKGKGA